MCIKVATYPLNPFFLLTGEELPVPEVGTGWTSPESNLEFSYVKNVSKTFLKYLQTFNVSSTLQKMNMELLLKIFLAHESFIYKTQQIWKRIKIASEK